MFFNDRALQTSSSISLKSTQNYYIEVLTVVNGLSVLSVGVVDLLNILSSLSSQNWFNSIRLGNFKSCLINVKKFLVVYVDLMKPLNVTSYVIVMT